VTKPLLIEHDDGVDRVTLNRPDSLNALDPGMIDALNAYFESLQRNRSIRVVVLKGTGSAFCAGLDLKHAMARRAGQQEPSGVTESLDSQRRIADIVTLMRRSAADHRAGSGRRGRRRFCIGVGRRYQDRKQVSTNELRFHQARAWRL
jgi:enoyl-CoA hydratase/carnithine racemase